MPHNKNMNNEPEIYTDEEAVQDLAILVAQTTSGVRGAIPESNDYEMAVQIVQMINTRYDDPGD